MSKARDMKIEVIPDSSVSQELEASLRVLLVQAFEDDFSIEDWQNSCGGARFVGWLDDEAVAHGSVVPRVMRIDGLTKTVGYVEAIAVAPNCQRKGLGKRLMQAVTEFCQDEYEVSMLSTAEKPFYRRFGWRDFEGESFVLSNGRELSTIEESAGLMYLLRTDFEFSSIKRVVCDDRIGDVW